MLRPSIDSGNFGQLSVTERACSARRLSMPRYGRMQCCRHVPNDVHAKCSLAGEPRRSLTSNLLIHRSRFGRSLRVHEHRMFPRTRPWTRIGFGQVREQGRLWAYGIAALACSPLAYRPPECFTCPAGSWTARATRGRRHCTRANPKAGNRRPDVAYWLLKSTVRPAARRQRHWRTGE